MKNRLSLIIILSLFINLYSQDNSTINITSTGSGITKNNAINDALRNALEQTYGGFISSKTNISDDKLFMDEIVAITNGEIHDYELISESEIESGHAVTIVAKISKLGLNNFVTQSGGDAIIFDTNVFSTKIRLQRLNEEAEIKSINNILEVLEEIYARSIEFEFTSSNPKINERNKKWRVDFEIITKYNENILNFIDYFSSSLEKIAMTKKQKISYEELGKTTYPILVNNDFYYFRNEASYTAINKFLLRLRNIFSKVKITTNNGREIANYGGLRKLRNYYRNFFIPYLNHSTYSYGSYEMNNGYLSENGELSNSSYYSKRYQFRYSFGLKGRLKFDKFGIPETEPSNSVLMLNKDNRFLIEKNEEYDGRQGIWIGEIKGDGGNISAGGETLFMKNIIDFNFSFSLNNFDNIYINGNEISLDKYLSQVNLTKPIYYTRSFTGGGLQDGYKRWSNTENIIDINNLKVSKKKMKRIQKRIAKTKLNITDIKLKLKKLMSSVSIKVKNNYNGSKDLTHSAKFGFYLEFTEDEMFSNTGYKLVNEARIN